MFTSVGIATQTGLLIAQKTDQLLLVTMRKNRKLTSFVEQNKYGWKSFAETNTNCT